MQMELCILKKLLKFWVGHIHVKGRKMVSLLKMGKETGSVEGCQSGEKRICVSVQACNVFLLFKRNQNSLAMAFAFKGRTYLSL